MFFIREQGINKTEEQGYALRHGFSITLYPANHGESEPALIPCIQRKADNHRGYRLCYDMLRKYIRRASHGSGTSLVSHSRRHSRHYRVVR